MLQVIINSHVLAMPPRSASKRMKKRNRRYDVNNAATPPSMSVPSKSKHKTRNAMAKKISYHALVLLHEVSFPPRRSKNSKVPFSSIVHTPRKDEVNLNFKSVRYKPQLVGGCRCKSQTAWCAVQLFSARVFYSSAHAGS